MALLRTSSTIWEDIVDPTVSSDSSVGYQVGDLHRNTASGAVFYVKDVSVGAAIWVDADPSAGGGSGLTSVTNAGMLAIASPTAGDQVYNTTWKDVFTFDGDVWLTPNLIKMINDDSASTTMYEGFVVVPNAGGLANEVTGTTTGQSVGIFGVVRDIYGSPTPGAVGEFVTVCVNGRTNVEVQSFGSISIGDFMETSPQRGRARDNGTTGGTGCFGFANQTHTGGSGVELIEMFIQGRERF